MNLSDMSITRFSDTLASNSPAPGGGSTAALQGALGAALIGMVAELTVGKKAYAEHQHLLPGIIERAACLRHKLLLTVESDTAAYNAVGAVLAMPKNSGEEQAARNLAMEKALQECTLSPYHIMCYCLSALELAEEAVGIINKNAISDMGVAALSLKAATQGAWLNILINLNGIKDGEFAGKYRGEGEAVLGKALLLADAVYDKVLSLL
jgi:formiminotetrahydrofolate cyclodeaminase